MSTLPTAIALIGPTATGKSDLALMLAERFPLEIVSLDSAQVYREMDIGTAKPDAASRARVPHHLLDLITPEETYSCARFRHDALAAMADIAARGRIPLLVGGTMLYYRALVSGLSTLPEGDREVRAAIDAEAAQRGWPALHAELARHDPATAARLSPHDAQRIQRALELFRLTGVPPSRLIAERPPTPIPYRLLTLALIVRERARLAQRIAQRFHAMLSQGLIAEVETLRQRYRLRADSPSMRCVGYRQVWEMLEGQFPATELAERGIAATRQLAKRQLTWLRSFQEKAAIDHLFDFAEERLPEKMCTPVARFLDAAAP